MKSVAAVVIALSVSFPLRAEERVPAFEIAVDPAAYMGRRITVIGCELWSARTAGAWCSTRGGKGPAIEVRFDPSDIPGRRAAMERCGSMVPAEPAKCRFDVSAVVKMSGPTPELTAAMIRLP